VRKQSKKKISTTKHTADDSMRPEYDFGKGVRGKYAKRYAAGVTIRIRPSRSSRDR
jgi:hypothetical protein